MYLSSRKRKKSNSWRVIFLILLIAIAVYAYTLVQRKMVENPFLPTPVPTRSAFSYATEAQGLYLDGNVDGAIAAYRQALELDPNDVSIYVPLTNLLVIEGWVHPPLALEAVELGREAISMAPNYAPAWAALGHAYDWTGQVSRAIDACLRAIELDPAYAEAYAYLAEAYADAEQMVEAQQAARTALELDPRSVDANRNYGYVLEVMGDWSGASRAYQQALSIQPNLAYLYMDVGKSYQALSDTGNAIEAFQRASELDPDRAEALDQLGWTYANIQEYERAQTYLEQAVEVNPEYAPAYGHLAYTYWTRRNYEDAVPNYEKAIDLAYRAARREAQEFYVTVEPLDDEDPYPAADVVLRGDLESRDAESSRLAANLLPEDPGGDWALASGALTLSTVTGEYTLSLEGMPALPNDQVYVGWFDGLNALDDMPLSTGPLQIGGDGSLQLQLVAKPVRGPRIEYLYTLGLAYFYMAKCERAYPLFNAALQMDPEEVNALEGIRLCQEAEGTPVGSP